MADGSLLPDYKRASTEAKPTGSKPGVTLMETDTGNEFVWSGSAWYLTSSGGISRTSGNVRHSSYLGAQTIGTTETPFAFATGTTGVKIRVTHATQTIKIGMGASAAEADTNASLSIAYDINDKFVIEGRGSSVTHFSLLGSGAGTTVDVVQVK